MKRYVLNECSIVCDECGKQMRLSAKEMIVSKKTPDELMNKLGWSADGKKDKCPDCIHKQKGFQGVRLERYEIFKLREQNSIKTEEQLKRAYLMEVTSTIQSFSEKEENLLDKALFQSEMYRFIGLLSSMD